MYPHISKQKISYFRGLRQKKNRLLEGLFIVEGEKSVLDTVDHFKNYALITTEDWILNHPKDLPGRNVFIASQKELERISSLSTPPPLIAVYFLPEQKGLKIHNEDELVVMLDEIQDPGNLGTIIRLCDWFGVKTIYASPNTTDCYSAKCVQASMGSLSRVEMVYTDLSEVIILNPRIPVYGLMLEGKDIFKSKISKGGFIIMGNEGNGLSLKLRKLVTQSLLIPSYPPGEDTAESLNVACATAITLAEFRRKTD